MQPWELLSWDSDIAGLSLRKTLGGNFPQGKKNPVIIGDCICQVGNRLEKMGLELQELNWAAWKELPWKGSQSSA